MYLSQFMVLISTCLQSTCSKSFSIQLLNGIFQEKNDYGLTKISTVRQDTLISLYHFDSNFT